MCPIIKHIAYLIALHRIKNNRIQRIPCAIDFRSIEGKKFINKVSKVCKIKDPLLKKYILILDEFSNYCLGSVKFDEVKRILLNEYKIDIDEFVDLLDKTNKDELKKFFEQIESQDKEIKDIILNVVKAINE